MSRKKHEKRTGKNRRSVLLVALTTAVMATLLLSAGAGTAGAFTGCTTLNSPGTYTLDSPITNSSVSSCISITSSDVVFDGNNNYIDGVDKDQNSIGIDVDGTGTLTNVTVRNVNLTGWGDQFGRGAAIEISETDASGDVNVISDVNITRTGGGIAVSPDSNPTTGVNITDSVITRTGDNANAINLQDTPQVNITDNVFRNSGAGILRIGGSGNLTFVNNTFGPTDEEGVVLFPASDDEVTFRDDTFVDISGPDIDDRQPVGPSGTSVTFSNTTSGVTSTVDFDVRGIDTIDAPNAVPSDPPNDTSVSEYLNVTEDSFASSPYLDVTFEYDPANVPGAESALDVWKYNGSWTELGTGPATDTAANEVQFNVTNIGSVFAPLAGPDPVSSAPGAGSECVDRRDISRGQEGQECPTDREISRGESREELDRSTGRNSDTSRRDRGRRGRGR